MAVTGRRVGEPARIGGYRVLKRLGEGGMGVVYLGVGVQEQPVAIKIIRSEHAANPAFRARFEREVAAAQRVRRFCTAPILDADPDGDPPYLVTEFVDGPSLHDAVAARGPLRGADLEALAVGVAAALTAIHDAGIVHRDLKPANVLLSPFGPRVIDFGLAHLAELGGIGEEGKVMGTPSFMAPEQIRGEAATPATDVFAWAGTVAYAASDRPPFAGREAPAVMHHILTGEPDLGDLGGALRDQVRAALSKAPAERPSAHQILQRLVSSVAPAAADVLEAEPVDAPPAPGPRPYLGLRSFESADAELFFGRAELAETLLERLAEGLDDPGPLAVVGPSGSGKSSLLRTSLGAGRLAVPGSERWPRLLLAPGPTPLESLVARVTGAPAGGMADEVRADPARLAALASRPSEERLVIVVDQLEELFTLCGDERERSAFVDALAHAARRHALVVLAMRADFFAHAAALPGLVEPLSRPIVVGPMTEPQLREAIEGPAAHGGWRLEPGLVETVLADLHTRGSALPLLSHALAATWSRRRGRTLTIRGYREAGGLHGSIAATAEEVYSDLDDDGRDVARRVLLHLVAVGVGTEDTRRRLARAELTDRFASDQAPTVHAVIEALLGKRLLVADRDTIEISHEALIQAWPRLRDWLAADREWLQAHARLTEAAETWHALGREPGSLYRRARLEAAREWLDDPARRADLSPLERAFLDAGVAARRAELATARARARRLRILAGALAALAVLATVGAVVALRQRSEANAERTAARSRQLAAQSELLRATDAPGAMAHALAAWQTAHTPEARAAMIHAGNSPYRGGRDLPRAALAVASADGRWVAEFAQGSQSTVRSRPVGGRDPGGPSAQFTVPGLVTDVAAAAGITAIADLQRRVVAVAGDRRIAQFDVPCCAPDLSLSADGRTLAIVQDERIEVRTLPGPGPPTRLTPAGTNLSGFAALSADGRSLAAGDEEGRVMFWNVTPASRPVVRRLPRAAPVNAVAYRPDGGLLAAAGDGGAVHLWRLAGGRPRGNGIPLATRLASPGVLGFSPSGRRLSVAGTNGVEIWDVDDARRVATLPGQAIAAVFARGDDLVETVWPSDRAWKRWTIRPTALQDGTEAIDDVEFAGSSRVITASDRKVVLWPTSRRTGTAVLAAEYGPLRTAVSPDGRRFAANRPGGAVRVWDVAHPRQRPLRSPRGERDLDDFGFVDADTLIGQDGGTLWFWDVGPGGRWRDPIRPRFDEDAWLATARRGGRFALGGHDGRVQIWSAAARAAEGTVTMRRRQAIRSLAFSADGRRLVAFDGVLAQVWDAATRRPVGGPIDPAGANGNVALSPDGRTLATGDDQRNVQLWDLDRGTLLATLTGHDATVSALAFAADGRELASGSEDGTVLLWTTDLGAIARRICGAQRGDRAMRSELARLRPGTPCPR